MTIEETAAALDAAGAKYVSADAQSSSAKQLSDIESLIAQGVDALVIACTELSTLAAIVDRPLPMFDTAQMAYALGHPVVVVIDDTKKHTGYCYANSIQVRKN